GLRPLDHGLPVERAVLPEPPPQRHHRGLDSAAAPRQFPATAQLRADLRAQKVLLPHRKHGRVAHLRARRGPRVVGRVHRIGRVVGRALARRVFVEQRREPVGLLLLLLRRVLLLLLGDLLLALLGLLLGLRRSLPLGFG